MGLVFVVGAVPVDPHVVGAVPVVLPVVGVVGTAGMFPALAGADGSFPTPWGPGPVVRPAVRAGVVVPREVGGPAFVPRVVGVGAVVPRVVGVDAVVPVLAGGCGRFRAAGCAVAECVVEGGAVTAGRGGRWDGHRRRVLLPRVVPPSRRGLRAGAASGIEKEEGKGRRGLTTIADVMGGTFICRKAKSVPSLPVASSSTWRRAALKSWVRTRPSQLIMSVPPSWMSGGDASFVAEL